MIEHNKLVRDRIPEIIRATGKTPVTRTVADVEERKRRLIDKLIEEVQEYKDKGIGGPGWTGLLIRAIESGEPAPPLSDNGHPQTCSCVHCEVERFRKGGR